MLFSKLQPLAIIVFSGVFIFFNTGLQLNDNSTSGTDEVLILRKTEVKPKPAATVTMTNQLKFTPDEVTIKVGETVLWNNSSLLMHTVTCDPEEASLERSVVLPEGAEAFDSGKIQSKDEYSHTFTKSGDYKYFCKPHEGANMVGWIHVKE